MAFNKVKCVDFVAGFRRDRRGNAMIIFGLSLIPIALACGAAIDYTRAAMVRGRLAATADAAALAAMTPAMMKQTAATAKSAAIALFAAEAAQITGVTYDSSKLNLSVTDSTAANATVRTVSVSYAATVNNFFGVIENLAQANFTVTAGASVSTAPNINFYLMLDSSPSMELPATSAGISAMQNATGCALACHETNTKDSELTQYPGWGKNDSYTYAENNGITLRIDNVRAAAQSLVSTAQNLMSSNNVTYQMAAYTFSDGVTNLLSLTPTTSSNVSNMQNSIAAIAPPLMSDNGELAVGSSYTYPTSATAYTTVTVASKDVPKNSTGLENDDAGTNFNLALQTVNSAMPNPGNGATKSGDTPQEVLMIVTDGVDDVSLYNSMSCNTSYQWSYSNDKGSFYRCQQPVNTSLCSTIKNRGIRIAVLYTTYFPVTSNSWYTRTVAPFISQVPSNLQNCASSTNLYAEVSTDGDITAAINQLFLTAIQTAPHLTQ